MPDAPRAGAVARALEAGRTAGLLDIPNDPNYCLQLSPNFEECVKCVQRFFPPSPSRLFP